MHWELEPRGHGSIVACLYLERTALPVARERKHVCRTEDPAVLERQADARSDDVSACAVIPGAPVGVSLMSTYAIDAWEGRGHGFVAGGLRYRQSIRRTPDE